MKTIADVEIVDAGTVRLITKTPNPNLPLHLTEVPMVVKRAAEGAQTQDFNTGKAAIGAGPYKLVNFLPGDKVILERFADYWGAKPAWDKVNLQGGSAMMPPGWPRLWAVMWILLIMCRPPRLRC